MFKEVVDILKMHNAKGVGIPGSFALHLRLKQQGIDSEMVQGYATEPSGTYFIHTWLEVEHRIYDVAGPVLGYSRKDVKYYMEPPRGIPRQDTEGKTKADEHEKDVMEGHRKLKGNRIFRRKWLRQMYRRVGKEMLTALFTDEILREVFDEDPAWEWEMEDMKMLMDLMEGW